LLTLLFCYSFLPILLPEGDVLHKSFACVLFKSLCLFTWWWWWWWW
jgi:hypothetical protein